MTCYFVCHRIVGLLATWGGGGLYKEKKDLYPSTYVDSTCQTSCVLSENYEGGGGCGGWIAFNI